MGIPEREKDIYKDTPLRLLGVYIIIGYANEVGEALRGFVGAKLVRVSYGIATIYVIADTMDKGVKTFRHNSNNPRRIIKTLFITTDTLIWQMLASVIIPGFTINRKHLQCSEEFYKNCIIDELALENNEESRQKMLEILKQNHLSNNEENSDELDSDDDDDIADITERLVGVDLDNADQVWEKLTEDEQQEFIAFLKSEDVMKLIPPWTPWWSYSAKNVEDVESAGNYKAECPHIIKIKDFREISKKEPADCVKYNLINVIAAYAFATRYFNGEHYDFCKEVVSCVVTISLCLKVNQNFEDFETAVKSVEFQCIESDWIVADTENFKTLREDLDKIVKGPELCEKKFYILCALSDLYKLLNSALTKKEQKSSFSKVFPNDHFPEVKLESKNKIKSCIRKVEYLLSFAKDYTV
ncbi:MTP18 domain containing protein [Asbolus verrucosus]|uniref:MTP18 domain containing protein n=1 Tax=Asbolus verrucosus TaxID=1661398 RepID=A0A482VW82_ASBVE|nr:MTP18 domain containing protein [Asbolus verrucosus]